MKLDERRDYKETLSKDLDKIVQIETATSLAGRQAMRIGICVLFLAAVAIAVAVLADGVDKGLYLIVAGIVGGYMALNIGANDVANNMGPAVGSKVLTMVGALVIAAICEAAGAVLAGGDVVETVKKGIIDPSQVDDTAVFIHAMLAALLAGALWTNLATYIGAPVSTTHSIVGGVLGAGLAAVGLISGKEIDALGVEGFVVDVTWDVAGVEGPAQTECTLDVKVATEILWPT